MVKKYMPEEYKFVSEPDVRQIPSESAQEDLPSTTRFISIGAAGKLIEKRLLFGLYSHLQTPTIKLYKSVTAS